MRVAFGECVFDSERRELRRRDRPVHLSPKAFLLLEALLEARPRALSKAQLHDRLWPDTFVSASSLGRVMAEVRAAIGDDARSPAFIRTVHRFGLVFCGTATDERVAPAPAPGGRALFRLDWSGHDVELAEGVNVLGRESACAVRVEAPGVSRRHAQVVVEGATAVLHDLGSKNGTFLAGRRLEEPAALADGDVITVGTALITVRALRPGGSTETVPGPAAPDSPT